MTEESNKNLNSLLKKDIEEENDIKKPKLLYFLFTLLIILISLSIYFFYEDIKKNIQIKKETTETKLNKKITIKNNIPKNMPKSVNTKTIQKKESKISKEDFYKLYNSKKQEVVKCYDYKSGFINPSEKCKRSIDIFLTNNKNALRYQIISVVGTNDIKKYDKYNKNIQKLIVHGLSTKRVIEVSWYLKKTLGENIIVTANNYFVESKKGNQGIIIKAYY